MNTAYEFETELDNRIAYVRPVQVSDLPDDVRDQVGEIDTVYAVHSAAGERLAIVRERSLAFVLARQNNLMPVTVH